MKIITKFIDFVKAHPFKCIFIGWLLAFVVPLFFKPGIINKDTKDTLNYYEISFLSASALFTGIAFAATYSSLMYQRKNLDKQLNLLEKQTKMGVFSEVSKELGSEDFKECRKYINSSSFDNDLERIKQLTQQKEICLQDFKNICHKDDISGIDVEERQHLRKNYNMIIRFCSKMEYLGFIYYNTPTNIIVDYYGRTILNMYKRLKSLIEINDGEEIKYLYYHFAYLYNFALRREKEYYEERDNVIKYEFINKSISQ